MKKTLICLLVIISTNVLLACGLQNSGGKPVDPMLEKAQKIIMSLDKSDVMEEFGNNEYEYSGSQIYDYNRDGLDDVIVFRRSKVKNPVDYELNIYDNHIEQIYQNNGSDYDLVYTCSRIRTINEYRDVWYALKEGGILIVHGRMYEAEHGSTGFEQNYDVMYTDANINTDPNNNRLKEEKTGYFPVDVIQ